jgi:hypothetical protein
VWLLFGVILVVIGVIYLLKKPSPPIKMLVQSSSPIIIPPVGGGQLVHNQTFTFSGFSGAGTKSRSLTSLVADTGTAADGTLDSQWSGSDSGPGIGIANHTTPYTAAGGTTMNAPTPYVSRIIAGDCNVAAGTGMWINFARPTGDYVIRAECYYRAEPNWTFSNGSSNNFKIWNINGTNGGPYDNQAPDGQYAYLNFDNGPYSNTDVHRQLVLDNAHGISGSSGFLNPDLNGNNIFRGSPLSPWTPGNGWIKQVVEMYCTSDNTAGTGGRVDLFENSNFNTNMCWKSGTTPYKGRTDNLGGSGRSWLFGGYTADRGANTYRYWGGPLLFDMTAGGMSAGAHVATCYVGDNPVFLSCTKLVAQHNLTAWADGSISFTFWKGDLVGGTTGYFFVQPEVGGIITTGKSATISASP